MKERRERASLEHPSLIWRRRIGSALVSRKGFFLERERSHVSYTVASVSPGAHFSLFYDPKLVNHGIALDWGGRLIHQGATTESLAGRPAGIFPERFMTAALDGSIGICLTNFGWQKGAFLVKNGRPVLIANDQGEISGSFDLIGLTDAGWGAAELEFKDGRPVSPEKTIQFRIGASMPLIVRDTQITLLEEIIGDPRFLADLRNVFDFGFGKRDLPGDYWGLIRLFLPNTPEAARSLLQGEGMIVSREIPREYAQRLSDIIAIHHLKSHLSIEVGEEKSELSITAGLSLNRLPFLGVGYDGGNNLLLVAADSRERGFQGPTIQDLARIMRQEGAVMAGLGCAGGDVALIAKTGEKLDILNLPSNRNHQTRRVPNFLIASP